MVRRFFRWRVFVHNPQCQWWPTTFGTDRVEREQPGFSFWNEIHLLLHIVSFFYAGCTKSSLRRSMRKINSQ